MDYVLTCSPTGIELNEADRIDNNHVPIRTNDDESGHCYYEEYEMRGDDCDT